MHKIVIYTSIYGERDILSPVKKFEGIDYICYTDNLHMKSNGWTLIYDSPEYTDSVLDAKRHKIFPHTYLSKYDISIWVDGNTTIVRNPIEIINKMNTTAMFFNHNDHRIADKRDCIYDEAGVCIKLNKDNVDTITQQINRYSADGYPKHNGLVCGGIIVRKHNDLRTIKVMEDWWNEIKRGSKRDQLSFNYVAWKHNFKFEYIPGDIRNNKWFKMGLHKK